MNAELPITLPSGRRAVFVGYGTQATQPDNCHLRREAVAVFHGETGREGKHERLTFTKRFADAHILSAAVVTNSGQ
ncbi:MULTISPECIES: hypothetical protein [Achromobacter]|jgi:hypothetical protein|uniref:Uncharacterized protein n=1 Tax=Achromobacter denitrificans TaxID=32002 RepID=A0ABZ3FYP3_ACHDE|nr:MULTISPECIES: hypothetical protein [Achromobacter]QYJ20286.1 hypothetical protein KYT87_21840 [Achromobacter sp. ES-001]CAB3813847.1 hypothetical protein LMG26684_00095 [Achromobacter mucicolens]CAB3924832.1 hypothetical protein LMG2828_05917 [Achromobacter piechaudii]